MVDDQRRRRLTAPWLSGFRSATWEEEEEGRRVAPRFRPLALSTSSIVNVFFFLNQCSPYTASD